VFVVDEYGAVQGVITVRDVLEAITGEFSPPSDDDAWAVRRADGSWLMDGLIPVPELKDRLELRELPEEDRGRYNTLAGMVMLLLGRCRARPMWWNGMGGASRWWTSMASGSTRCWSSAPNPLEKTLDQPKPATGRWPTSSTPCSWRRWSLATCAANSPSSS
jgi:hypothetical protein